MEPNDSNTTRTETSVNLFEDVAWIWVFGDIDRGPDRIRLTFIEGGDTRVYPVFRTMEDARLVATECRLPVDQFHRYDVDKASTLAKQANAGGIALFVGDAANAEWMIQLF